MTVRAVRRPIATALAGSLLLAACSGGSDDSGDAVAPSPSAETLAVMVAQAEGLSAVSATLKDAGLGQVFDGTGAYTLLAPQDAAFDELGATGEMLRAPEQRPAMVAVLRDHIVPGYLTPADIKKAIELDDDGKVAMRTMGGHTLTFSEAGDALAATAEDGTTVRFAGEPLLASNGVAIPVDGLALDVGGTAAAAPE